MSAVARIFDMLGLPYTLKISEGLFTVIPPFERRDIVIPEDLIEEVGRILGYDHVQSESLPAMSTSPDQARFRGIESIKDFLIEHGWSEISTQTFARDGDISLANPLDQTRPALRTSLAENMIDALARAKVVAPRVFGPAPELKLFEIGTVFRKDTEHLSLVLGYDQLIGKKRLSVIDEIVEQLREFLSTDKAALPAEALVRTDVIAEISLADLDLEELSRRSTKEGMSYIPKQIALGAYKSFSLYPFALRDIAVWTPAGTEESEVINIIAHEAEKVSAIANNGDSLLARIDLFDRFEKKNDAGDVERISYASRLVFESMDRTLSDEDINPLMEKVTAALNAQEGFEVR
jgi:phenylalanyl-tRNA synthetase beta chain